MTLNHKEQSHVPTGKPWGFSTVRGQGRGEDRVPQGRSRTATRRRVVAPWGLTGCRGQRQAEPQAAG